MQLSTRKILNEFETLCYFWCVATKENVGAVKQDVLYLLLMQKAVHANGGKEIEREGMEEHKYLKSGKQTCLDFGDYTD